MFFVTKRKVNKLLLQVMNSANEARKTSAANEKASEQDKRDAFMFAAGCIQCASIVLEQLKGE